MTQIKREPLDELSRLIIHTYSQSMHSREMRIVDFDDQFVAEFSITLWYSQYR